MVYKVIGLMSGSSLDGVDIVYTHIEEIGGKWNFKVINADCIPYNDKWVHDLKHTSSIQVYEFLRLNTKYGRHIGELVNNFIEKYNLYHNVHFVVSHGHTVFHEPSNNTTFQLGDGATISAVTSLPVIADLRNMDVALGGQGAPIVPIGDKLLFSDFEFLLNIGGIANLTVQQNNDILAFDVCPANQILNILASYNGMPMDFNGDMAANGKCIVNVLDELNEGDYYKLNAPKSLSNIRAQELVFPKLMQSNHNINDLLHTTTLHIAMQVQYAVLKYNTSSRYSRILITGGGAFNKFLVKEIEKRLKDYNISVVVPDDTIVKYKEAIVMALIGALRWRGEINVLSSVTGAQKDSIGGALWMV